MRKNSQSPLSDGCGRADEEEGKAGASDLRDQKHLLQLKHKVQEIPWDLGSLSKVTDLFKGPIPINHGRWVVGTWIWRGGLRSRLQMQAQSPTQRS